jgi:transcriptional regulator with GAF, ATPase, and Fis domain
MTESRLPGPCLDDEPPVPEGQGSSPDFPAERDLAHLLRALTEALKVLREGGDAETALQESFAHAQLGLRARKAILLYVRQSDPIELKILRSSGLTWDQQLACQAMRSADGVSPTVIGEAIASGKPVFIPNAQKQGNYQKTTSLSAGAHSVLCAPIIDPMTGAPIAVLYFQNKGLLLAFEEEDLAWLTAYATAIGQGFGLHLSKERRIQELQADWQRFQGERGDAPEIIGDSEATKRLRQLLDETFIPATQAQSPKPILILGATGTGKDLIAQYLHYYSPTRGKGPYVAYNCASIRGDLAESKLFGHTRGSFTGAVKDSPGLFRDANKGVLFLDEIGELPMEAQALLLRALETRTVQPVGQSQAIPVDVQLAFATHRDLAAEAQAGRFRADLYNRISALKIRLAPLSHHSRRSDVRPLLSHFLARQERALKKKTGGLTPDAFRALMGYSWPGNVREIDNVCTALVTHARLGAKIDLNDIETHCPEVLEGPRHEFAEVLVSDDATFEEARTAWMREFLMTRIERHGGRLDEAAKGMGIVAETLRRYRIRYGLNEAQGPPQHE